MHKWLTEHVWSRHPWPHSNWGLFEDGFKGCRLLVFLQFLQKSVSSKDYLFLRKVKKGIFKSNQKGTTLQPLRSLTIYVHKFRRDEIPTWHKDNNRTKCLESKPPRFRGSHRSIAASAFSYPIFANNREWHIKSNFLCSATFLFPLSAKSEAVIWDCRLAWIQSPSW